jgi:hypothetical protein
MFGSIFLGEDLEEDGELRKQVQNAQPRVG